MIDDGKVDSVEKIMDSKSKGVVLMAICPLCNSLKVVEIKCPKCNTLLDNAGKVADFVDPYNHYKDEETVKMDDGYPNTTKDQICPHLMVCRNCGYDKVMFIQEE